MKDDYQFAGLYDLRLKLSQKYAFVHIPEFLYSEVEQDTRLSGAKQFDYVDPSNRGRQIEMEQACTQSLKDVGGYLAPHFKHIGIRRKRFRGRSDHHDTRAQPHPYHSRRHPLGAESEM